MGLSDRIRNGLAKIISAQPKREFQDRGRNRMNLNGMKTYMEALPGLSQPVWGPEISTVGAYSREGYTSRTFDTPAVEFRQQANALQVDEDVQLAINHLSSQVTGGEHYIQAMDDNVVKHFEQFTKDFHFDIFDTELIKELLWYGNSIWKPRMGIQNVNSWRDMMHIPISSFVRIWWDRQRIPYKYEFRGAEYQGYHNPGEVIHFSWNPINASVFGTGFGVSMTSPRFFEKLVPGGDSKQEMLPSMIDRKYTTQHTMQLSEQRYVSHNVWSVESGDEQARQSLQSQIDNLDIGQDVVAGTKVEVQELGSSARNFNPEQFTDITLGPTFKALNDFRGKQGSSESHQYANAKTSAVLDEIGLAAFPVAVKDQLKDYLFKPWYLTHPLPDERTGGLTYIPWDDLKFDVEFGEVEKKDISVQDHIKLLELYIQSPLPKDPLELRKLFEDAGLGLQKDFEVNLENFYNDPMGNLAMQGAGIQNTAPYFNPDPTKQNMQLPQHDIGGGPVSNSYYSFDNQNVGEPAMDDPMHDSMVQQTRPTNEDPTSFGVMSDIQNKYKRGNQSQDWDYGRDYE